jgi:mono/diheme cytochrome c family protein
MIRHGFTIGAMLGAWLALVPTGAFAADDAASQLAAAGRAEFLQYCASCHGAEGKGDGPLAEELRTAPADLTRIAHRRGGAFPDSQIAETIDGRRRIRGHGPGNMPVWGRRFDQEVPFGNTGDIAVRARISLLVAYLRSIQVK